MTELNLTNMNKNNPLLLFMLIFFIFQSCLEKEEVQMIDFNYLGISFQYPSNWKELDHSTVLFGIADNDLFQGSQSNILLVGMDSMELRVREIERFSEYYTGINYMLSQKENYKLKEPLESVDFNQVQCKKVVYELIDKNFLQTHYFFEYRTSFYSIIVTEPIDGRIEETQKILSTFSLQKEEKEKLF